MNKIGTEHLSRTAFVYVRQSTSGQLTNNPEIRRRQYGTERLGFEQLLAAVCTNTAGAVFAIEDHAWHGTAETGTRFWNSVA